MRTIATAYYSTLYLQWVPSHCGLEGNERADNIAKEANSLDQDTAAEPFTERQRD